MGCSESKHGDVATGNTIFRRKQSSNGISKNSKDIETIKETTTNGGDKIASPAPEPQKQPESDNVETESAAVDVKDVVNENSSVESSKEDGGDNNGGDVEERMVSRESPSHFFSSRKDEELGIDGIVSDGRSVKSEYNTPRHGTGRLMSLASNEDLNDDVGDVGGDDGQNAVEKKELADHGEKPEAAETDNGKEEIQNFEETLVKKEEEEEEAAKTNVEENVSSPSENKQSDSLDNVEEEKEEEKHIVESANQDLKTST